MPQNAISTKAGEKDFYTHTCIICCQWWQNSFNCVLVLSLLKEHRKLGWTVLILKYDLGKSLSKETWCKMADTKKIWLHILKDEKCM